MKHETQCVGNSLLLIPIPMLQKELDAILDLLPLFKEHILKRTGCHKLGLGIHEVSRRKRVLDRPLCLGLNHLVKVVSVSTQFICHPALVVGVAGIHKRLEVLDIMLVAIELELDDFGCPIRHLEIHKLEVDIIVQAHRLKLVRKVIVICDTQEALHSGEGCHEKDHSIHTAGIDRCRCCAVRVGLRCGSPLAGDGCTRGLHRGLRNFNCLSRSPTTATDCRCPG